MSHQQEEIVNVPDFGDQVAFTVGASYVTGFLLGIGKGVYLGRPKSWKLPRKILWNNFFNSVGTQTSKIANSFAGAGILFFIVGKTLSIMFEDQLDEVSPITRNMICGAATGAVFKSTLGVVPSIYGSVLGAGIAGTIHMMTEYGNRKGWVAF